MSWGRVKIIANPKAGWRKRERGELARISDFFSRHSSQCNTEITRARGDGLRRARKAVAEGYNLVIAVGGDGTVNEVASPLVGTDTALGIIPTGSGNGLARALGISLRVEKACQALLESRIGKIDVGQLGERYFFSTAGIGFDALVGKKFEERHSSSRGLWPYFYIVSREIFKHRPEKIELRFNGREITAYPLLVAVTNTGQYGGGAMIAPQAAPTDGLFEVCIIHRLNLFLALFCAGKLFTGQMARVPQVETYQTDSLQITMPRHYPVHVDGEPFPGDTLLRVKLWPRSLGVLVPGLPS